MKTGGGKHWGGMTTEWKMGDVVIPYLPFPISLL
jgi:hypothetical protein